MTEYGRNSLGLMLVTGLCVLLSSCGTRPTATRDRSAKKSAEVAGPNGDLRGEDGGEVKYDADEHAKLMQAIAVVEVDPEKGVEMLKELESVLIPPHEIARLVAMASALNYLQRYEEALDVVERAMSVNSDEPHLHLVYAQCHNGLKQYEKAIEHAEQYAALSGTGAAYFVEVGEAHAGMGRTGDAVIAFKRALAEDPQSTHSIVGLMKVLPTEQGDTLMAYYKKLDGLEDSFTSMAEFLIDHEDAKTLRKLIDTHRLAVPDSKNIDGFESALYRLEARTNSDRPGINTKKMKAPN